MKRVLFGLLILCAACSTKIAPPRDALMSVAGAGSQCVVTLEGQRFVTQQLASKGLEKRLKALRAQAVLVTFQPDVPYRCIGYSIITLQHENVQFRIPQLSGPSPTAPDWDALHRLARNCGLNEDSLTFTQEHGEYEVSIPSSATRAQSDCVGHALPQDFATKFGISVPMRSQ